MAQKEADHQIAGTAQNLYCYALLFTQYGHCQAKHRRGCTRRVQAPAPFCVFAWQWPCTLTHSGACNLVVSSSEQILGSSPNTALVGSPPPVPAHAQWWWRSPG